MGRILSIDFGKKRTGIAVTDPLQIIANGLVTVATSELLDFLKTYVAQENVERIVIGRPMPTIPIEYYDERFTSVIAQQTIIAGGIKKKTRREDKGLVDEVSATIILQDYMRSKDI